MADTAELTRASDSIEAELRYIVDDGIAPVQYVDWPEEAHKAHVPSYETRPTPIQNGRTARRQKVNRMPVPAA